MRQLPKISKNGMTKQIAVNVDKEVHRSIELLAAQRRISMATLVKGWIYSGLGTVPGYHEIAQAAAAETPRPQNPAA